MIYCDTKLSLNHTVLRVRVETDGRCRGRIGVVNVGGGSQGGGVSLFLRTEGELIIYYLA